MEADQNCPPPFGRHRITVQGNAIGLKSRQLLWSLSVKCSHRFGGSALVYKSGCAAVVHRRSYCDFRGAAIHEYAAHRAHVCADQRAQRGVGDVMLSAAMILDARSIGVAPITAVYLSTNYCGIGNVEPHAAIVRTINLGIDDREASTTATLLCIILQSCENYAFRLDRIAG